MLPISLFTFTLVALAVSWFKDKERTIKALGASWRAGLALAPSVLGMIALVGFALALLPPDALSKLFAVHGAAGFALISMVGALVTIPAPIAFPLAGSLLKLGVSPPALATFITTLTMVGVVTAPMEAAHFGRRFTLIRQCMSFILALVVGALMGVFL